MTHSSKHKTKTYTRLTAGQFYAHRVMVRNRTQSIPHRGGLLFQQYLVDVYCRVEGQRLFYLRSHQEDLRAEVYQELAKAVEHPDYKPGVTNIGRRIVLPASYPGSPRHMHQNYLDAMAMVRVMGKPDFYITFTANPQWPEIVKNLLPGQHPHDRPDLVARVFHLKLQALLDDLTKNGVLGGAKGWIWVVEFQKRGLPHAHILLIVRAEDKPRTPEDVDNRVCAELPDPLNPQVADLLETISSRQLHGPCGPRHPSAPCMEDGQCTKGYPREFREDTALPEAVYPLYRRRDRGNFTIEKSGHVFDSRDVVPYNPGLSLKYNAHLNVEVVSSIKAVKYLYKYSYKGHDRATLEVGVDEIQDHVDARYVGPAEAAWRLLEFPLLGRSHHVERLAVHLPNNQSLVFRKGDEQKIASTAATTNTTLTAWFKLNQKDATAKQWLYSEIPEHYTWDLKNKAWKKRVSTAAMSKVIGRLHGATPAEQDRFYLYLLLLHRRGIESFEALQTVAGEKRDTFRAAAEALGLIETDNEYELTLKAAAEDQMPHRLRLFFAHLLLWTEISEPVKLWNLFRDELSEDFFHATKNRHYAIERTLTELQTIVENANRRLHEFGLPEPEGYTTRMFDTKEMRRETTAYNSSDELRKAEHKRSLMYEQQAALYDDVVEALNNNDNQVFFIDGPGGSGKTFVEEALLHYVRGQGQVALACAWSGVAATLLEGGRTCHSTFGFPVPTPRENVPSSISAQSGRAEVLRAAQLIIWDEAPMSPAEAVTAADELLQDLCGNDEPFGGKCVVFAGDFRQVLPVMPHCSRADVVAHSLKNHYALQPDRVRVHSLTGNRRAKNDPAFAEYLLRVGDGREPTEPTIGPTAIRLPPAICTPPDWTVQNLLEHVFPNFAERALACAADRVETDDTDFFKTRAILAPTNVVINEINDMGLDALEARGAPITTYSSTDSIQGGTPMDYDNYPLDFLHSLNPTGVPPHELRLTPGSVVLLLRNLDSSRGLMNGIRCIVKRCLPRYLDVLVLTGRAAGQRIYIPRIPMAPKTAELPFVLVRRQFPVRLAWAMTINKAQGQSLEEAGLALVDPVFSHGQLYVAMSRVGGFGSLKVWIKDGDRQGTFHSNLQIPNGTYTSNIVWKEVLLDAASTRHSNQTPTPPHWIGNPDEGDLPDADDYDNARQPELDSGKHKSSSAGDAAGASASLAARVLVEGVGVDDLSAEILRNQLATNVTQRGEPSSVTESMHGATEEFTKTASLMKSLEKEELEHLIVAQSDLVLQLIQVLAIPLNEDDDVLEVYTCLIYKQPPPQTKFPLPHTVPKLTPNCHPPTPDSLPCISNVVPTSV